ncbi:MAG: YtxH domain-containing protein [Anaerolineae bacterium]|nr:YtxH domain-containing protein [Anaerolineae bacterium]
MRFLAGAAIGLGSGSLIALLLMPDAGPAWRQKLWQRYQRLLANSAQVAEQRRQELQRERNLRLGLEAPAAGEVPQG